MADADAAPAGPELASDADEAAGPWPVELTRNSAAGVGAAGGGGGCAALLAEEGAALAATGVEAPPGGAALEPPAFLRADSSFSTIFRSCTSARF